MKKPELQSAGCFVHGGLHISLKLMILSIFTTCILSFTELKHILSTEAKAVRKFGNELKDMWILEAN